jgi:hypothetical protein
VKKALHRLFVCLPFFCLLPVTPVFGDKLVMINDRIVTGTVLETNVNNVLLLTDYGTIKYPVAAVKEIRIDQSSLVEAVITNTLPDSKTIILRLHKQPWATDLKQIPATIIDKGILKNVPYISFRCGGDYEVNIYGDLDHPAGIEAGVYRKLISDDTAKRNCAAFVRVLLGQDADKSMIQKIDFSKDLKTNSSLTFEVTPPTAEDAYGGWWLSVYSEQKLDLARATDDELKYITADKTKPVGGQNPEAWTADELALARSAKSYPTTITFTDSSGEVTTDAKVIRVIDGSGIIWRKGASGGLLKLSSLPEGVRAQFGYDPVKAKAADVAEQKRKDQLAAAIAQNNAAQIAQFQDTSYASDGYSGGTSSSGGGVYVRGYTRSNGTYVQPYTRSSPRR